MRYQEPKRKKSTSDMMDDSSGDKVTFDDSAELVDISQDEMYPAGSGKPQYISDNTAFMHWSTELEQVHDVIDNSFLRRNRHRVGDINKFLPLSNITTSKQLQIFRLRRMNMTMAKDASLDNLADETMLDNLADYNTSRGIGGFYQNALITTKRELLDKSHEKEKKGFLKQLVRGRQSDESAEFMGGE